jgi:hypothetical protein
MAKRDGSHLRVVTSGELVNQPLGDDIAVAQGGGGGPMDPVSPKDYTDAKVAGVKAELMTEMVTLEGKIIGRLDKLPTVWQLVSAIGAGVLATLAILAYAGDRSDSAADRAAAISSSLTRLEAAANKVETKPQPKNEAPHPATGQAVK